MYGMEWNGMVLVCICVCVCLCNIYIDVDVYVSCTCICIFSVYIYTHMGIAQNHWPHFWKLKYSIKRTTTHDLL